MAKHDDILNIGGVRARRNPIRFFQDIPGNENPFFLATPNVPHGSREINLQDFTKRAKTSIFKGRPGEGGVPTKGRIGESLFDFLTRERPGILQGGATSDKFITLEGDFKKILPTFESFTTIKALEKATKGIEDIAAGRSRALPGGGRVATGSPADVAIQQRPQQQALATQVQEDFLRIGGKEGFTESPAQRTARLGKLGQPSEQGLSNIEKQLKAIQSTFKGLQQRIATEGITGAGGEVLQAPTAPPQAPQPPQSPQAPPQAPPTFQATAQAPQASQPPQAPQVPQTPGAADPELANLRTQLENIQKRITESIAPTQAEIDLQLQLQNLIASRELGLQKVEEQPIATPFITGQQTAITKRAGIQALPLQAKLSALQSQRKAAFDVSEAQLGFEERKLGREEQRRIREEGARRFEATQSRLGTQATEGARRFDVTQERLEEQATQGSKEFQSVQQRLREQEAERVKQFGVREARLREQAGKEPKGATLSVKEATDLGLPKSLVGRSEQEVFSDLGSSTVPEWFLGFINLMETTGRVISPQEAESRWNEFRRGVLTETGSTGGGRGGVPGFDDIPG